MGAPSVRRSSWMLARVLALLASLAVLACNSTSGSAGEFEDDGGHDEGTPPDLPQPQCDPRRVGSCMDGQKCSYVVDAEHGPTNRCVDRLGDKLEGESCERIGDADDCDHLRICWATDADGKAGICVRFCDLALECPDEDEVCSVANDGSLPLCLRGCDPLAQDCPAGWGCYPDPDDRWVCDVDRSGATGAHGDPCECINCCDAGLACLPGALVDAEGCGGEAAAGCCAEICDVEQASACPTEAERCEPFYPEDEVMLGLEDVGTCRL